MDFLVSIIHQVDQVLTIKTMWPTLRDFLIAVAGSLAGAFAGAWGAQRIAERGKNRKELLEEIRNTNAANYGCVQHL